MPHQMRITSPRGAQATISVRTDTNDAATIHSTFWFGDVLNDEYGLRDLHPAGWAIDIGAHIGSVALALALDNPELMVIAVEAVPDNADLLRANAESAGVSEQVIVLPYAAGGEGQTEAVIHFGYYDAPGIPPDHARDARYIGNVFRSHGAQGIDETVPAVSLSELLDAYSIDRVSFLKIDCEGCEWRFLASPAIDRVDLIIGEYHVHGADALVSLLAPTHDVTITHEDGGFGLFRAVARRLEAVA